MAVKVWLWKRYKRTGWVGNDGRRVYTGEFSTLPDVPGGRWEECEIQFAALHPRKAMSAIHLSGKHPMEFDDTVVN